MRTPKFTLRKSQGSLGAKHGKEGAGCVRASPPPSTRNWEYQGQPGTRLGYLDRVSATQQRHVQAYLLRKPRSSTAPIGALGTAQLSWTACLHNPCSLPLADLSLSGPPGYLVRVIS